MIIWNVLQFIGPKQRKSGYKPSQFMRSNPVKENHIGSAVTEIFRYRQTDSNRVIFITLMGPSSF